MKKIYYVLFALAGALSAFSCVKESYDPEDCPPETVDTVELKRITIVPEWLNTEPQPGTDSIRLDIMPVSGGNIYLNSGIYGRDVDLEAGSYTIVGWEDTYYVSVDSRKVTVDQESPGIARESGEFSGGSTETQIQDDIVYQVIPLPMHQQTRQIIVRINFTGAGVSLLESVQGTMSGIAIERDIENGFPPVSGTDHPEAILAGSIPYTFSRTGDIFLGGRNLIGIDGRVNQFLSLRTIFETNYTTTFDIDITEMLDRYHTQEVHNPWYIDLYLNVGIEFDFTIEDWRSGGQFWLIAD